MNNQGKNMISKYKVGEYEWVDLDSPTGEDIDKVVNEYKVDSYMAKDMATPTPRPRVHSSKDYIYAVMHIPVFKHSHSGENVSQEVDFVIGEKVLITARYDSIDALHRFAKTTEVNSILEKNHANSRHPFFGLIKEIQRSIFNELAWSDDWLSDIERKIFGGMEREMVFGLSKAARNILNFKKTARPHRETLDWISDSGREKWGKWFEEEVRSLIDNSTHIMDAIASQNEFVIEMRETNNSLLSTKQNEVMKMLTVLAFLTLPASIIAGIFNMNVDLPIAGQPGAFYIIIGLMVIASLSMFALFKSKKWL
jgi:magnesium transporter